MILWIIEVSKRRGNMLYYIKQTRMIKAAKDSLLLSNKPQSLFGELMVFVLVAMICSVPQSLASSAVLLVIMFNDPAYLEIIANTITSGGNVDAEAINKYVDEFTQNIPSIYYVVMLASAGFMILGAIIYCKNFQKRSAFSLGFNSNGFALEYLVGLILGLVMISLPALICHLTGCVVLAPSDSVSPLTIALFLAAFILQGMGEEALFRGYLLTSLARRNNIWFAIVVSSLMFAVFHGGNAEFSLIAFINIALFGVFASVFTLKRGNIWGISAIHSIWNFAQGNLFGFRVSGNPKLDSVLTATDQGFGSILSGGRFGLEGGLGATVVLLIAILCALLMPTKQSEIVPDEPEKSQEEPISF